MRTDHFARRVLPARFWMTMNRIYDRNGTPNQMTSNEMFPCLHWEPPENSVEETDDQANFSQKHKPRAGAKTPGHATRTRAHVIVAIVAMIVVSRMCARSANSESVVQQPATSHLYTDFGITNHIFGWRKKVGKEDKLGLRPIKHNRHTHTHTQTRG
jgi:hypothetical protein